MADLSALLRRIRNRQQFPPLRLCVPGKFGQKQRRKTGEIAKVIRTVVTAAAKGVGWKTPPKEQVSVSLDFFSNDQSAPAIHKLVKFYLDELRGVAFVDDRQINHLTAQFCRLRVGSARSNSDDAKQSRVYITVEQLANYNRRFDLCFEVLDEDDFAEDAEQERELSESTLTTDDRLCSPSLLAALPEEMRRSVLKIEREALQRRLQRRVLSIGELNRYDRPGGRMDVSESHPLVIDLGELPQAGESADYQARIRRQMQQFKKNWQFLDLFTVPMDVDVRVGSRTITAQKDLDNIMRDIAPILADEFFREGAFLNGYRIYVSDVMDPSYMANKLQLKFLPMFAIYDFDLMISKTVEQDEEWIVDRI